MKRLAGVAVAVLLFSPGFTFAAGAGAAAAVESRASEAADPQPHPRISADSRWATPVVQGIVALFALAILAGIATPPPQPAPAPHHDDHHDAHDDHGHGHGGH